MRQSNLRWLALVVFIMTAASAPAAPGVSNSPAAQFSNADCLDCHLDPSNTRKVNGKTISLLFPTNSFQRSVHAKLNCVDCHAGIKDLVHPSKLPPPNCVNCHDAKTSHEQAAKEYATR